MESDRGVADLRPGMNFSPAGLSHIEDEARLQAIKLAAVDRFIPAVMLANVAVAVALSAILFGEHPLLLSIWCAIVALISGLRTLRVFRTKKRPQRPASTRTIRQSVVETIIVAVVNTGVPAWLLTHSSGLMTAFLLCHLVGSLWAGSMVLATVLPAAVAYVIVIVAFIDGSLITQECSVECLALMALVLLGAATALQSAAELSGLFMASQRQKLELEHQGEVIGILLKDYEEQTSDWLWEVDERLHFCRPSPRLCEALDVAVEEIADQHFGTFLVQPAVAGNDQALAELKAYAQQQRAFRDVVIPLTIRGELRWWSVSGRPAFDGNGRFSGFRGVTSDITAARVAQDRISHLAHHDALTNLPNRSSFCQALDRMMKRPRQAGIAVISVDLDGFKPVNDRYGHPVGDALLVAVSERLRAAACVDDVVARFGGDEFLILRDGAGEVEALCRCIVERMIEPFEILGEVVTVGVSVGVAFAPNDGDTPDELIKNADAALHRAKGEGRGTFRFFEPKMDRRLQHRQQLVHDLRGALARDELVLHFQPFVSAENGTVTGCEALIRWVHPVMGLVSPVDFIPLAEESGLIVPIGAWVIEQACLEAARWPSHQRVSVNISPRQFHDRSLPDTILAALTRAGLSPRQLEVEVTETVLIDDSHAALDALREIRALGVRIALDDFGTGYSSLSYLRSFPFDRVKIDRSFVQDLVSSRENRVIVQAIRDLARGLGMSITAEGVETEAQAAQLRSTGCEELQGYLFSRPITAAQYEATFNTHPTCVAAAA